MPAITFERPSSSPGPAVASPWVAWAAVAVLLAPSVAAVCISAGLLTDIPWGDHLTLVRDTGLLEGVTVERLFRFHNEHLIVPTRLAVAADYRLWHGANLLPAAASLLFTLGIVAVEAGLFRRVEPRLCPGQAAFATAILAAVLLNGRLTWTLTFPILLQHVSANFFVVLTLAAFARLAAGSAVRRGLCGALCLGAAGLAAVSSASGVFALPAAAASAAALAAVSPAIRRGPWRWPAAVGLAAGLGIVAAYAAAHAAAGDHGRPRPDVVQAVRFAVYFPGGAWFRDGTWPILHRADPLVLHAVVLGFWAAAAAAGRRLWLARGSLGEFEIFHVAAIGFVVLTAAVGGLFRGGLGDLEALNKKYAPTALLAWASVVSLVVRGRLGWLFPSGAAGSLRPLAVAAAVTAAILPGDAVEFHAWRTWAGQLRGAIAAYAAGVRSDEVLLRFFPDAGEAGRLLAPIAADRGYWFRHGPGGGNPLPADDPGSSPVDRVPDHLDYALEFIGDHREPLGRPPAEVAGSEPVVLRGWAVDREAGRGAAGVEVIAAGRRFRADAGLPRPDVAEHFARPGFAASGFRCILPAGTLPPGPQDIGLRIVLADGEHHLESPPYRIVVE